jgi:ACT domain-containing protein
MGLYNNNINKGVEDMSTETIRQTIDQIKTTDSMKAVKVAFDLSESNQDSITKVMQVVSTMDNNMKLLATKVLELEKDKDILFELIKGQEKTIQSLEGYANREI